MEQSMLNRLEDFISLAKRGEKINLAITLNKQILTRKFYPYKMGDSEDEIDMYFLAADFVFGVGEKVYEVTKFYVSGIEGDSPTNTKQNICVANERLKMDYKRLKEAKIVFLEKFWDERITY